jgi:hypothetical protein
MHIANSFSEVVDKYNRCMQFGETKIFFPFTNIVCIRLWMAEMEQIRPSYNHLLVHASYLAVVE